MNWETLPTLACFWMFILVAVQYFKRNQAFPYTLTCSYFLILFFSGILAHFSKPIFAQSSNVALAACLRTIASGFLLTLVSWHTNNKTSELGARGKKRSALMKLPFLFVLVALALRNQPRVYSVIELIVAVAIFFIIRNDKKRQGVRLRLFIKGSILGAIFLIFKLSLPEVIIAQIIALAAKLAALYYIYCLISSYAAQGYLQQFQNNTSDSYEN